jgi:hypothetical protein
MPPGEAESAGAARSLRRRLGMKKDQLARLLAAAIVAPSSLLVAGCECPHTVVVESKEDSLDAEAACEAAATIRQGRNPNGGNTACAGPCGDSKYLDCRLDGEYTQLFEEANPYGVNDGSGGAGGGDTGMSCPEQGATITCEVTEWRGQQHPTCPIPGRRPAGLAAVRHDPAAVGRFLATSAHFEAAAVIAFERVAAELAALGAPAELLSDLARAARDEVRHAAVMTALAERRGAAVPAPVVAPATERSVEDIAIENAVEGLVNETFAAATALFQAEHAEDPEVRAAMRRIADDECAHAALAFQIAAFLEERLDRAARARVERRRAEAVRALPASFEEPGPEVRRLLGVPTRAEANAVHRRLCAGIWGDGAARDGDRRGEASAPAV